jgi:predicted small secreted protein
MTHLKTSTLTIAVLLLAATALAGCSGTREALGLGRNVPDEFAVVSRAPLAMPPDYSLPPPTPGATRPQEESATATAEATMFGSGVAVLPESRAEVDLLAEAGADSADPGIRQVVDREAVTLAESDETFVDSLLFWQSPPPPGTVIDPAAEQRRLASNAALGLPLNEGEVPTIERKRRAPLEGIF